MEYWLRKIVRKETTRLNYKEFGLNFKYKFNFQKKIIQFAKNCIENVLKFGKAKKWERKYKKIKKGSLK